MFESRLALNRGGNFGSPGTNGGMAGGGGNDGNGGSVGSIGRGDEYGVVGVKEGTFGMPGVGQEDFLDISSLGASRLGLWLHKSDCFKGLKVKTPAEKM